MSQERSMIKIDGSQGVSRLEQLLRNNNCMIRFHMYGCMWCDKMKPEWHKLADRLSKKSHNDIIILDVDSEAARSMSHPMKDSINGFPTIVFSPKGDHSKYYKFEDELGRTADTMESWLSSVSKKSPSSEQLLHSISSSRSMSLPILSKSMKKNKIKSTKKRMSKRKMSKRSKLGGGASKKRYSRKFKRYSLKKK